MSISLQNTTAMLVDDEAYFRRFVTRVLTKHGIGRVIEAIDGNDALKKFIEERPNLVILDINMPHMDGMDALRELRKIDDDVAIIMLTSIADEMMVERCVIDGATYFIRKDVPADQLYAEIHDLLFEEADEAESCVAQ